MPTAYTLRAEYEQTYDKTGGGFTAGGRDFHIGEALQQGNGTIVVPDTETAVIAVLDTYPALKRVAAPEGAEPVDTLGGLTATQLRQEAQTRGLDAGNAKKDAVLQAIRDYDAAVASGDQERANNIKVEGV